MINKKLLYEQPDCELLVVRFEGNIMSGPDSANNGYNGSGNDLGDLDD